MRFKSLVCVAVLFGVVSLFAQATTEPNPAPAPATAPEATPAPAPAPAPEAAPAPTPAPAPEVAPAPAPAPAPVAAPAPAPAPAAAPKCCDKPAGIQATFYGMGMFRLREVVYSNSRKDGGTESATDYQDKLAYKIGVKVKVNEEVSGQFEIGNDWYATETVDAINYGNLVSSSTTGTHRDYNPYFSLAYMKWNPGCLFMDVGIIPMPGTSLLDLIGNGMIWGATSGHAYQMAAHIPWGVITNFSIPGVRLGVPILKDDFKLGINVTSTVLQERKVVPKVDSLFQKNNSCIMLMADVPMSSGALTVKPTFLINLNRFYKDSILIDMRNKKDNEIGAGLEMGYKISDDACLRLGFGYAHMANTNTWSAGETVVNETGMNGDIGTTIAMGPGKLDFDFDLSTDANNNKVIGTDSARVLYPFVDVKYGWAVNKNFIIMPRTRLFFTRPAKSDAVYKSKFYTWPEIMLFGTF
ncbi:MAG: hypothetical protein ABSF80_10875 [Chitinispirillaceae bacterium]|jgi:hypothetical protein